MAARPKVSITDPVLDAPYADAALRLGVVDAATLVRAKQEQKSLRRQGIPTSLRQLLIQSGVLSAPDQELIEVRLGISVEEEPRVEEPSVEVPSVEEPSVEEPKVVADVEPAEDAEDEAEVAEDEAEAIEMPEPSEESATEAPQGEVESLVFEETPELSAMLESIESEEHENQVEEVAEEKVTEAESDAGEPIADELATIETATVKSEAVEDPMPLAEPATPEPQTVVEVPVSQEVVSAPIVEPPKVTAPKSPENEKSPTPIQQPPLTPAMIAAAANESAARSNAALAKAFANEGRPWNRRPSRVLLAVLVAAVVTVAAGTAYFPTSRPFVHFMPKSAMDGGVASWFGKWNDFAASYLGGTRFVVQKPRTSPRAR